MARVNTPCALLWFYGRILYTLKSEPEILNTLAEYRTVAEHHHCITDAPVGVSAALPMLMTPVTLSSVYVCL